MTTSDRAALEQCVVSRHSETAHRSSNGPREAGSQVLRACKPISGLFIPASNISNICVKDRGVWVKLRVGTRTNSMPDCQGIGSTSTDINKRKLGQKGNRYENYVNPRKRSVLLALTSDSSRHQCLGHRGSIAVLLSCSRHLLALDDALFSGLVLSSMSYSWSNDRVCRL